MKVHQIVSGILTAASTLAHNGEVFGRYSATYHPIGGVFGFDRKLVPDTAITIESAVPLEAQQAILAAWINRVWIPMFTVGGGDHRDHDTGGGYSINLDPSARIFIRVTPTRIEIAAARAN